MKAIRGLKSEEVVSLTSGRQSSLQGKNRHRDQRDGILFMLFIVLRNQI